MKTGESLDDLRAGGVPMVPLGTPKSDGLSLDPALAAGSQMGKRYVEDTGAEVLVTKPGADTLSAGETPLRLKEAKPLPASD